VRHAGRDRPRRVASRILALVACATALPAAASSTANAAGRSSQIVVGTQTVTVCGSSPLGYCGQLSVPLDYRHPAISPRISISFEWYPADNGRRVHARGTVLPVEGGPGYPSIGSVSYANSIGSGTSGYAGMYGPLLRRWNMLAIDLRGTGSSETLNCPLVQHANAPKPSVWFENATARCAASLNHRWHYTNGSRVHASDLFTTAASAEDAAAVIRALEVPRVDLYGDSYGSWFSQVFASRYPRLLRSLILDSTYPTVGIDPWYISGVASMPAAFDLACSRWAACAQAEAGAPGSPWIRIGQVAQLLRAHPISGTVAGPYNGGPTHTTMGAVGLVNIVNDAGSDSIVYQQLDATDRALLFNHDQAPLLRLYAQRLAYDENYMVPANQESEGLYLAVACLDYRQLFKLSDPISTRLHEFEAAQKALPPQTFFPFTTAEWLSMDENTETYDACLKWPRPTDAERPIDHRPPLVPGSLPVLDLGGEFDTLTPPVDHPRILKALGGKSRFVLVANTTHVVGEGSTTCGSLLVERFVANPSALGNLNTSCAAQTPAIHSVGVFADSLAQEPPITPAPGNTATVAARELAAAAVQTAGDAFTRFYAAVGNRDTGLHGGTVAVTHTGQLLTLHRDQLIPGVAVSGTVALTASKNPLDGFDALAHLTTTGGGTFTARWAVFGSNAVATINGTVGPQTVAGTSPAP
jgi:pimeloyl-ACP methyl ester carboxylesterase